MYDVLEMSVDYICPLAVGTGGVDPGSGKSSEDNETLLWGIVEMLLDLHECLLGLLQI